MAPAITHWLRRAPLGSGSFATVSLAVNLDNGDYFAVKSIPSAGSASELCALRSELSILQSLHSPRIVSCFGADCSLTGDESACNLFLEYMDGGSIAELIKNSGGSLDEDRAQRFTRAIVEGLVYLHEQEIVHCDLKCRNILVGSAGVKIADFGAAKKLAEKASKQEFNGTPLWMAPEVVRGEEQGCASDIWSLGCTVVEMLQGRPPWGDCLSSSSSTAPGLAISLLKIGYSSEAPPLPEIASSACQDFLCKSLHRDPARRWTAAQLLDHAWLKGVKSFDGYSEQDSPRSILDFPASQSDGDDDDDNDKWSHFPAADRLQNESAIAASESATRDPADQECSRAPPSLAQDVCVSDEGLHWISVRCANADMACRQKAFMQKPFMQKQLGMQVLKPGQTAELRSATFLMQRKPSR